MSISFRERLRALPLLALASLPLLLGACDDTNDAQPTSNKLTLELEHLGSPDSAFALNRTYTNAAGNRYQLNSLLYFISNVKLTRADGTTVWAEPNSYHLIDLTDDSDAEITLAGVPNADYATLTFSLGVDSVANSHTDQTGDLSPNSLMAWDWQTGYKFLKTEGRQLVNGSPDSAIVIHTGLNRSYRTLQMPLPENVTVRADIAPEIHLAVDVNRLFGNSAATSIDFGRRSYVQMGGTGDIPKLMDNAAAMFTVEHVHNDHEH